LYNEIKQDEKTNKKTKIRMLYNITGYYDINVFAYVLTRLTAL